MLKELLRLCDMYNEEFYNYVHYRDEGSYVQAALSNELLDDYAQQIVLMSETYDISLYDIGMKTDELYSRCISSGNSSTYKQKKNTLKDIKDTWCNMSNVDRIFSVIGALGIFNIFLVCLSFIRILDKRSVNSTFVYILFMSSIFCSVMFITYFIVKKIKHVK